MQVAVPLFWAITAGYVTSGLLSSLYQWLRAEPVSFRLLVSGGLGLSLIAMPLLVFAGPAVLARNVWRGRVIEGREWRWIVASAGIILCWSFITGVIVLEFLFKVRGSVV